MKLLLLFVTAHLCAQPAVLVVEQDRPVKEPETAMRTAVIARGLHRSSYQSGERLESQTVQTGLYASGSSLPDSAGSILYSFEGALIAHLVESKDEKEERRSVAFEPGRNVLAGITLCDLNVCGWTAGRGIAGAAASLIEPITGSHGPRAGTSFYFQGQHAVLHITPWFLPEATGGGLDGILEGRSIGSAGARAAEDTGRGARLAGGALFRYGGIAFHYESSSRRQSLRPDIRGRETLELSGIGFLLRKEEGFFRARFSAAAEHSSGRAAAATNDERGNPFARIDGSAARSGLYLAAGPLHFRAEFFLPEPRSPSSGRRSSSEVSGYIAYGDAVGPGFVLRSAHHEPFPGVSGADPDKFHAGVLQTEIGWQSEKADVTAEFRILRPLMAQEKSRGNPLRTTRRDPQKLEYHEGSILAGFKHAAGQIQARYSRMHGRKNGRSFLAAESAELSFLRYF